MFHIEPHRFFSRIFGAWFLFTMLAVFSAGIQPTTLILPAVIVVLGLSYWCVNCAYRTERFSKYASLRLFTNLAVAPGFAFVMALVTCYKQLKLDPVTSLLLSSIPIILALVVYAALYGWRSSRSPLIVRGERVEVIEAVQENHWRLGAVGAGLGTLVYPVFHAYKSSSSMLVFLFIVISLFMLFYHRSSIAALRTLKEQESRERRYFTFMNVEEIREKRAASLIGRMFTARADR